MAIREELTLGIRSFQDGLDRARKEVRKASADMKQDMRGVGAGMGGDFSGVASFARGFGGAALGALGITGGGVGIATAVKEALTAADDLADLMLKLNETAEALQRVDFAGQQAASVGVAEIGDSLIRLERALGDVENQKAAEALAGLGLKASDLMAMPIDQKILALSDAFQRARETGTGVADIHDLLGRTSANLIPLFEQTGEALRSMFAEAPVLAGETVQEMAKINDEIDGMIAKAKTLGSRGVGLGIDAMQFSGRFFSSLLLGSDFGGAIDEALAMEASEGAESRQSDAEMARRRAAAARQQDMRSQRLELEKFAKAEAEYEVERNKRQQQAREKQDAEAQREKEAKAKQEQVDLDRAGDLRFQAMPVEQQIEALNRRLQYSLGKFSTKDEALAAIDSLLAAGEGTEARRAMEDLNALEALAGRMPTAQVAASAQGSFASLMDQIFGRGTPEQQLEETRRLAGLADDQKRVLDKILEKMDEPPPQDTFTDFGT